MIIQRLYELAQRENLAGGIAFEKLAVPFMVSFDENGSYLGILDRRSEQTIPSKGKNAKPKIVRENGKVIPIPRAHGNTANRGFARYFVDTLPRVLPFVFDKKDEAKCAASRKTFWEQIAFASKALNDPALSAAARFGEKVATNNTLIQQIAKDIEALKPGLTDRCGLAFLSDHGVSFSEKANLKKWYAGFLESLNTNKLDKMTKGFCQITGEETSIPYSHGFTFKGVPGGLPTGAYMVSLDKDSFQSYGLDGAVNSGIGIEAAQGYSLALQFLLESPLSEAIPDSQPIPRWESKIRVGGNLFLFWTREIQDLGFMALLESADPDAVRALLASALKGKETKALDTNDFYLLVLTGNAARIVVRDYLETPLSEIQGHFAKWFNDLDLAPLFPDKNEKPFFGLFELVKATAGDVADPLPTTPTRLLMAALRGDPLSDAILAACLRRIKVEGAKGCTRPRLSLVKLFLVRKGILVTEALNTDERNPAYLYGRLLEIFDEIQYAALGDINAGVVDKFYGTFSAAPAMVMARLFANAQNHLRKLKNEKPGAAVNLERKLTQLVGLLPPQAPKGQLSLRDQGLFALGFYHQKAHSNQERLDRKATKEATINNS